METKAPVTEERISHNSAPSIHQCFPSNISEPDSSVSDEPLCRVSLSIASIFPAPISESDNSSPVLSGERLSQFCPSIHSIFPPPTSTQTSSPAGDHAIIPYNPIESCFPPRCDSNSDSFISSGHINNIINRYLRSFSIESYFPSFRSSSMTSDHDNPSPNGQILEKPYLKEFTLANLKTATRNFKLDFMLGEGGFGRVFKGWMDEKTLSPSKVGTGMIVAIKKLNPESFQEWQSEVQFLGRLFHPNLVKLLGYCWEDKELLLVYEFLQKGSLENHLFRRNPNIEPLSWALRLKIAIGAARGLTFLHASEKQVIYRDFKASHILLDRNYNAKISNFCLAKLGPSNDYSHVTTRVMGTYGYAAPEYIATGHLYVKSDVYGFGVVLLEMLTCLRVSDTNRPNGQQNLVDWLKLSFSDERKLKTILNVRMEGQYLPKTAFQAAQLTLKCLESNPRNRPSMKDVVEALERIESIKENPKETKINSTHSIAHSKETKINSTHSIAHGHGQQPIHHRSPLHSRNLLSYLRIRTKLK